MRRSKKGEIIGIIVTIIILAFLINIKEISNLVSTGDDTISYKKAIEKLNRKQMEEVGTDRSAERPINIAREKIRTNLLKQKELEQYKMQKEEIENGSIERKNEIEQKEKQIELLRTIKQQKEKEYLEQEKININKNIVVEQKEKLEDVEKRLQSVKTKEIEKINKLHIFALIILAIVIVVQAILLKNTVVTVSFTVVFCAYLIFQVYTNIKRINKIKKQNYEITESRNKLKRESELLQDNIKQKEEEIKKQEEKNTKDQEEQINKIKYTYLNKLSQEEIMQNIELTREEVIKKIDVEEKILSELKITNNTQEANTKMITQKLDELVETEELIEDLKEQETEILHLNNIINLVRDALQQSYEEMKENITPEFTQRLGQIMEKTSNGKYKNIRFNDTDGLTVELENGEYVNCERLSIGTIDQMYLALRLSTLKEISEETMPIILDEAFAYYDDERLKNMLEYIINNYEKNQVIILTCTEREKKILENLNIKVNVCEM